MTATTTFTEATPDYIRGVVLREVAGAPDTLIDSQVELTLKEFYRLSTAWRLDIGPYTIAENTDTYAVNPITPTNANAQAVFVLRAWLYGYNGSTSRMWLHPVTQKVVGPDKDMPMCYFMQDPTTMVLYPVPDKAYGSILYMNVALQPVSAASALPTMADTHHLDAITAGVLWRMYRMPKKPWTDKNLALEHQKDYRHGIKVARVVADRNYAATDKRWLFPPFAQHNTQMAVHAVLG